MQISVNGAIFFGQSNTDYVRNQLFPLDGGRRFVAPFWADVDTSASGNVWYRVSTLQAVLNRASMQIRAAFPFEQPVFTPTELVIVTWEDVGYFDSKSDKVLTLVSACYLYH